MSLTELKEMVKSTWSLAPVDESDVQKVNFCSSDLGAELLFYLVSKARVSMSTPLAD